MIYKPREDSFLLEIEVKKYARGKKFLDVGAGSGIQAHAALESGAKSVLAVDIDTESIRELRKKKIPALKSDLFSNISGKFDIIAFNPPYLPEDKREDKQSRIATTGGKRGDETIIKFLKQAKSHLNKRGIILLVISSLTPKERIIKLIKEKSFRYEVLSSKSFFFETLEVWKISR